MELASLKTPFVTLLCIFSLSCYTQTIHISLPQEANKSFSFILNKGITADTIQQGVFSFAGEGVVHIPDSYKEYIGMGALLIKGQKAISMIVNYQSFSLTQAGDKKYKFKNSPENTYLYSIMQQEKRQATAEDGNLYAAHFVTLIQYMRDLNAATNTTSTSNLQTRANLRSYAVNELDMDKLYTSGIWYNVIDGLTRLVPKQEVIGADMVSILKRIKSPEIFEHLATNLITITEQYGWEDAFDIIVPYIQESGRIEAPQGKMYTAFILAKVRKGMIAPTIEGLEALPPTADFEKTLLVFYQPDCHNCVEQMDLLIKNYPKIKEQKIRVVTISSDYDKDVFKHDLETFPWKDKLCDFKGFAGANFTTYGILGTPTFFLVDKQQVILGRYAQLSAMNLF